MSAIVLNANALRHPSFRRKLIDAHIKAARISKKIGKGFVRFDTKNLGFLVSCEGGNRFTVKYADKNHNIGVLPYETIKSIL